MGLTFTSACNRYHVIPEDLKGQVDRTVQFDQVKSSPASHKGEWLGFGGEVLSAKRLEDKARAKLILLANGGAVLVVVDKDGQALWSSTSIPATR